MPACQQRGSQPASSPTDVPGWSVHATKGGSDPPREDGGQLAGKKRISRPGPISRIMNGGGCCHERPISELEGPGLLIARRIARTRRSVSIDEHHSGFHPLLLGTVSLPMIPLRLYTRYPYTHAHTHPHTYTYVAPTYDTLTPCMSASALACAQAWPLESVEASIGDASTHDRQGGTWLAQAGPTAASEADGQHQYDPMIGGTPTREIDRHTILQPTNPIHPSLSIDLLRRSTYSTKTPPPHGP